MEEGSMLPEVDCDGEIEDSYFCGLGQSQGTVTGSCSSVVESVWARFFLAPALVYFSMWGFLQNFKKTLVIIRVPVLE